MLRSALCPALSLAILVAGATGVTAQTVTLDEGTFRILLDGTEAGMETFSIRQNGNGPDMVVIARGRVVLDRNSGGQEVQASIQLTGPALRLAAYDVDVRGPETERINARVTGNRASARTIAAAGENMREYLVSDGAILIAEGLAHQYYFVARRVARASATLPIIEPRASRQVSASVTVVGPESVTVAGAAMPATHYLVAPAEGAPAHVWADASSRVLKVEIPDRRYLAIRTAAPES